MASLIADSLAVAACRSIARGATGTYIVGHKEPRHETVTISDIDDALARRLAARAAAHGQSVEAEAKDILSNALGGEPKRVPGNLADAIRAIVEPIGGINIELAPRQPVREPPRFE